MDWKRIISKLPYPGKRARQEKKRLQECLRTQLLRGKWEWNLRLLEEALADESGLESVYAETLGARCRILLPPLQTLWIEDIAITGMENKSKRKYAFLERIRNHLLGKRRRKTESLKLPLRR